MQKIADEYANSPIMVKPGDRIHRIVALLCDTWIDDLTGAKITEIEQSIESWRWCGANGKRVD
jgi:hypothetical protein